MSYSFKMSLVFVVAILFGIAVAAQTTGTASHGEPAVQRVAPIASPVSQQPGGQPEAARTVTPTDMLIGAGDLLETSVYGAPDFDKKEVRVSGSGDVALPLIGPQHVEGMTVEQAQVLISKKLAAGQYFNNPQVTVFVKEYATQGVSVLGEVQKPGVYPLLGRRKLFDAISLAGGLTPKAGKSVTVTHRNDPSHSQNIIIGDDVQGSTEGNVDILPGDTVLVSKAGIVYVVGDVKLPGGFIMERGNITILQALALAQGANNTAALNSAKLIRNSNGEQKETSVPLKQIMMSKAADVKLQPDDILFVPRSAGKSAAIRGLEAILQTATGVAIYRP